VVDERFEMLPAADALHVFLRGERGRPGKDLEAVEPAVLDHQEPSFVAKGVEAATEQGERFVIGLSIGVLLTSSQALTAALVRKRGLARSLRGTVSIPWVVSKRSVK
jgi:hypothetical protein